MTAPTLMPSPLQTFRQDNGLPAAWCKLYCFDAGTSTPRTVYRDPAGLIPHENPITLDAKGECLAFFSGNYKIDLRYPNGAQVTGYPVDNFAVPDFQGIADAAIEEHKTLLLSSSGAAKIGYHSSGNRTVEQHLDMMYYGIANVIDPAYAGGADPTGVADSTAAIQAAINSGKVVFLSSLFKTTASLKLKPETVIVGLNEYDSGIIATGFTYPVFINDPAASLDDFARVDLSKFAIRNGTHALKFTVNALGVQSLGDFRNLRFEFQSVRGVECNTAMIANNFTNCVWFYSVGGIKTGREANLNNFINCRFEGLDQESVIFASTNPGSVRGGESNRFQGCRFEARNTPAITGNSVIRLDTCEGTVFSNCYFENTFTKILTEVRSNGTTVFEYGRHTGTESDVGVPGFKVDVFTSDGIVTFSGNSFMTGTSGSANMRLGAANKGMYTLDANLWDKSHMTQVAITSRNLPLASGVTSNFFRFSRAVLGGADDRQSVTGLVSVSVIGVLTGGTPFFMYRTFRIFVRGFANTTTICQIISEAAVDDNAPGAVLAFTSVAGQPTTDVVFGLSVTSASLQNMSAQVRIDVNNNFYAGSTPFAITCLV